MPGINIKCIQGTLLNKQWTFKENGAILFGREVGEKGICTPDNLFNDKEISRKNSLVYIQFPNIYLCDLESKNGTYLNGKKITNTMSAENENIDLRNFVTLNNGDIIGMGCAGEYFKFEINILEEKFSMEDAYRKLDALLRKRKTEAVKEAEEAEQKEESVKVAEVKKDVDIANTQKKPPKLEEIKKIGDGGFSEVFLVKNKDEDELQVLKSIKKDSILSERDLYKLKREASIGMKLEHPNIVKSYNLYMKKGRYHILMEYCDGGNVADYMRQKGGKLSIEEATKITLSILDALDYIHNAEITQKDASGKVFEVKGLVHRDVKPENFLLKQTKKGYVVKLSDFGLTKSFEMAGGNTATSNTGAAGTMAYVSRLQMFGYRFAKPYVDVFSVAACYYTMLTGKLIRDFSVKKEANEYNYRLIANGKTIPILEANKKIPLKLAQIIDNVLNEEKENPDTHVFTTAAEFKEKIINALK